MKSRWRTSKPTSGGRSMMQHLALGCLFDAGRNSCRNPIR
jgi:hypothetical protein